MIINYQLLTLEIAIKPRHLHIFLNPNSGKQQAKKIWQQVQLLWEKHQINFTVTETIDKEKTQTLLQTLPLEEIDGLVVIGGDGTFHEVINGLMQRSDWESAIATPIGIIPAGTSNGLCKSLLEISGESYDPISAAITIAQGNTGQMDLILVQQDHRRYYSFLSLAWGFISDVDIESDKLRYLGSFKNDIYALLRIWKLRTYPGKFSFVPFTPWHESDRDSRNSSNLLRDTREKETISGTSTQTIEGEFVLLWAMNIPWAAHNIKATPYAHLDDGAIDVLVVRQGISRWQLLRAFLQVGTGKHIDLPYVEYYKVRAFHLQPLSDHGILAVDGELVDYSPIAMTVLPKYLRVFSK